MALRFQNSINLTQNELQNVSLQKLGTPPVSPPPVHGQIYLNTGNDIIYYLDSALDWVPLATGAALLSFNINTPTDFGLSGGGTIDINNLSLDLELDINNLITNNSFDADLDFIAYHRNNVGPRKTTIQSLFDAIAIDSIYTADGTINDAIRTVTLASNSQVIFSANNTSTTDAAFVINNIANDGIGLFVDGDGVGISATSESTAVEGTVPTNGGIIFKATAPGDNTVGLVSVNSSSVANIKPHIITHSSGAIANNGVGWRIDGPSSVYGRQNFIFTNVTGGSQQADFSVELAHNSGSTAEKLRLLSSGQLRLPEYGVQTFDGTGTGAFWLAVDASGNIVEMDAPVGTIQNAYHQVIVGVDTLQANGADSITFVADLTLGSEGIVVTGSNDPDTVTIGFDPSVVNIEDIGGYYDPTLLQVNTPATGGLQGGGALNTSVDIELNITGLAALGTSPALDDELVLWDITAGAHRKVEYGDIVAGVLGGLNYISTWDAAANLPDISATTPSTGDYYIVGTAGTTMLDGINDWGEGDWVIYSTQAGVWQKIDNTDQVNSVFGRQGNVVALLDDYQANLITFDPTLTTPTVTSTTVQAAIEELVVAIDDITGGPGGFAKAYKTGTVTWSANSNNLVTHGLVTTAIMVQGIEAVTGRAVQFDFTATNTTQCTVHIGQQSFTGQVLVIGY